MIDYVYDQAEINALGGDPDASLAIEATPGTQMSDGYAGAHLAPSTSRGTHGYDPRRPEIRASLLLFGATVPHGVLDDARLVDIAPTIAAWLGLPSPNVEGRSLRVTTPPGGAAGAAR